MVSGKTLYYNSLKKENNKADTSVNLVNGSHTTKTALLPRSSLNLSHHNETSVHLTKECSKEEIAKGVNNKSAQEEGQTSFSTKLNGDLNKIVKSISNLAAVQNDLTNNANEEKLEEGNGPKRKGSVSSECSSIYSNNQNSLDIETPKQLKRLSCALRKSLQLEECNSEISFLSSETTRNSTPLNGSPNFRTNSLRFRKEALADRKLPIKDISMKSNPDVRKSILLLPTDKRSPSAQSSDSAHIVTIRKSEYETVPIGLSQDIPDVFL